ncbi:hypothetical protein HYC85_029326 [Camellia sinensis]|uniref:Uncharacterized protein n=1 Tax=Camellia sinensis TaxID=4442 RepID=A0A7J7FXT6_CAMSI|nr:hypothetical protein HYC85_029326 [Camellia sinensis]
MMMKLKEKQKRITWNLSMQNVSGEIPSRARSQSHHEALTHALEEGDTSSRPKVTAGNTIAAKRARGPTRGKEVQGLVDRDGKLSVPIPPEFRAPIGDYAAKLASKIGVEILQEDLADWPHEVPTGHPSVADISIRGRWSFSMAGGKSPQPVMFQSIQRSNPGTCAIFRGG